MTDMPPFVKNILMGNASRVFNTLIEFQTCVMQYMQYLVSTW